jgi:hypothetical protein
VKIIIFYSKPLEKKEHKLWVTSNFAVIINQKILTLKILMRMAKPLSKCKYLRRARRMKGWKTS